MKLGWVDLIGLTIVFFSNMMLHPDSSAGLIYYIAGSVIIHSVWERRNK